MGGEQGEGRGRQGWRVGINAAEKIEIEKKKKNTYAILCVCTGE